MNKLDMLIIYFIIIIITGVNLQSYSLNEELIIFISLTIFYLYLIYLFNNKLNIVFFTDIITINNIFYYLFNLNSVVSTKFTKTVSLPFIKKCFSYLTEFLCGIMLILRLAKYLYAAVCNLNYYVCARLLLGPLLSCLINL